MTRIAENQLSRSLLQHVSDNRNMLNKFSEQISSGYKVSKPGDSAFATTVEQYRETLNRIDAHKNRISSVKSFLSFQEDSLAQVSDLLTRAKEIAVQAGNEVNDATARSQLAREVWAIRDQLVSTANSKYQGRYAFGGLDDDDPPYDAMTYTNPSSGSASQRYVYDSTSAGTGEPAGALTRSVNVTDDLSVVVNTPGNQIFDRSIQALERLGRALDGYDTLPASGTPTGGGVAFNLPTEQNLQTQDISNCVDLLETARSQDILPERVSLGARVTRLETAEGLLDLSRNDAQGVLDNLQNADYSTAATNLTQAQNALQASYTVTSKILNLNILDYL